MVPLFTVITGSGFTVTVTVLTPLHTLVPVPATVNTPDAVGEAATLAPVAANEDGPVQV